MTRPLKCRYERQEIRNVTYQTCPDWPPVANPETRVLVKKVRNPVRIQTFPLDLAVPINLVSVQLVQPCS